MATKRNHSSCSSESDCETKKLNLQDTPVKITEMSLMEAEPTEQEEDIDRDKAIQAVKANAPEWFGAVFNFILKDLAHISKQAGDIATCKETCRQQGIEIQGLRKKVTDLETKNQALEEQISKLEDYSRKSNLIVKGIPEGGKGTGCCHTIFYELPGITRL